MRSFEILSADSGQRLDRYLRKLLPNASLGNIYKLARTGKIKVDGKRVQNETRLESGALLEIYLNDEQIAEYQKSSPKPIPTASNFSGKLSEWILYEDDHILALNKPAGINVHPGDHKSKEVSIIQLVHDYLGPRYCGPIFSPALVHRLDRDTSGVLLIGKDRKSLNLLLEQLQGQAMKKIYLALVVGVPQKPSDTIRFPLLRVEEAKNTPKVRVDPTGLSAVTHYRVIGKGERCSLLEVILETGRMHQIRVHMAAIGCPVLGDSSYGDRQANRVFLKGLEHPRQMLHAKSLQFNHPITGKVMEVVAPLSSDLQEVIEKLVPTSPYSSHSKPDKWPVK